MKDKRILIGTTLILLLLLTTGLSYAYFSTSVKGNDNVKDMVVEAGTLKLTYTDGPMINVQNIKPGWTTTKTVSVKNNGTLDTAYNIVWQELTNTILKNELVLSATCKRLNESGTVEGTCEPIDELPVRAKRIAKNISIESGFTHEYTFTFLFKETNSSQNYNQGKKFNGILGIEEYKNLSPEPTYCTYNGELTQGVEYTNGQYTYRYMQEYGSDEIADWINISNDGWGVRLSDDAANDDEITSKLCTYINNKPIVSMKNMFINADDGYLLTIDLSSYNTSNVINMSGMLSFTTDHEIEGLDVSGFDTSNVTDMSSMFYFSFTNNIKGLENFDTSNVTNMSYMFSDIDLVDVSYFDTSKVTDMSRMFFSVRNILGLNYLNTSNVTNMETMFGNSGNTSPIDLSSFDTSNVTNMSGMFRDSYVTTLDLSSFNTSNVTNMAEMFEDSRLITLDLSNFDTSNVTDMSRMFIFAYELKTIYASNKFNTDKVTQVSDMFYNCTNLVGGAGTKYDSKHVNNEYAHIDGGTSNPGYFTDIADKK